MSRRIALAVVTLIAPIAAAQGTGAGPSHLDAHRAAAAPPKLLEPLGDDALDSVIKGYEPAAERALASALLGLELHCPVLKVGIAGNGVLTAGLVKLQAGDRQSHLFSVRDIEQDAARVVCAAFLTVPGLDHLDLWVTIPWMRDFEPVHRPVFSLSVPRERVLECLGGTNATELVLSRCGAVRLGPEFAIHAIDGSHDSEVRCDLLVEPALDTWWNEFGAQARGTEELDHLRPGELVPGVVWARTGANRVALTIDDGPRPLITPLLLDVLRREGVKATFFVVGEKVEQYPELARMIVRDGHELANHSYSHTRLNELNPRGAWSQVRGCGVVVEQVTGRKMRWFRPPGGTCNDLALQVIGALGYTTVLWTANTGDWSGIGPEEIVANGLMGLRDGGIVLMHQGGPHSVNALPGLIAGIRSMGLEPCTVSEAVGDGDPGLMAPEDLVAVMDRSRVY